MSKRSDKQEKRRRKRERKEREDARRSAEGYRRRKHIRELVRRQGVAGALVQAEKDREEAAKLTKMSILERFRYLQKTYGEEGALRRLEELQKLGLF